MRVTVVGSGDAFGSGGRFQTCLLVGSRLLVDCGATSMTALRQQGIDPNEIDTVALTHLHGDHFGGLPFLVLDGQFRRRTRDLTVLGPPGTGVTRRFAVHVVEHEDRRRMTAGEYRVTPFEVRHASARATALPRSGGTSTSRHWRATATASPAAGWSSRTCHRRRSPPTFTGLGG